MQVIMTEPQRLLTLIERARAGDPSAFEAIVAECHDRLEAFVGSRIRPELRGRLPVADLTHETFSRAFESLSRFEGADDDAWFAWLAGIAKHVVLQEIAKLQRGGGLQLDRDPSDHEASPGRRVRREERLDRLREAIQALPEDYREVVQLCRIDGLRIREVAERMNRSPDAVKKLLWRALKELKAHFGDTESLHLPRDANLGRRQGPEGNDDD